MIKSIYPDGMRENNYSYIYADIVAQNYFEAKRLHNIIAKNKYDYEYIENQYLMEQHIIIVCVFSAMAIEAFLNDYAAACMGDSEFYDNFDKLSVISKFQLIAKFILGKEIDKSLSYYSNFKTLIKQRDSFVHNKSKESSFQGCTLEEIQAFEEYKKTHNIVEKEPELDREEIKKDFSKAQLSIKAMRDFAFFFDSADKNARVINIFFRKWMPEEIRGIYYNELIKEFKIGEVL